jgi:hypothetical protein
VVTENAFESKWVQNEVTRADRKGKPFFPLLLQGDPWLSVEAVQYVDVKNGSLPPEKFYERLEKVTPRKNVETNSPPFLPDPAPKKRLKLPKLPIEPKTGFRMFGIVAILTVVAFGMPQLINLMGQVQFPTGVATSTYTLIPTITKTPKLLTSISTVTPTVTPTVTISRTATRTPTKTPTLTYTPTKTYTIQPTPLVYADISASPASGKVPLYVSFDINLYWSDGDNACKDISCDYYWRIYDDSWKELASGDSKSFTHTFELAKTYYVQAGACSGGNCDTNTIPVPVSHK